MAPQGTEWLNRKQVAAELGISPATLSLWVQAGKVAQPTRLKGRGNTQFWTRGEVEDAAERQARQKARQMERRKTRAKKPASKPISKPAPNPAPAPAGNIKWCTYPGCGRRQQTGHDSHRLGMCTFHTRRAHTILNRRTT